MAYSASHQTPFSMLPKARTPWTEFVFSTGAQACVVAFLVWLRVLQPAIVSASRAYVPSSVQLVKHSSSGQSSCRSPCVRCQSPCSSRMLIRR